MFDHPQDAYRLAIARNQEIRESIELERLARSDSGSKEKNQPTTGREWLDALTRLRKIRIEVSLIVQEPQSEAGC